MLSNEFYYSYYEYSSGNGNWWHRGNYEPIITKEIFTKNQDPVTTCAEKFHKIQSSC